MRNLEFVRMEYKNPDAIFSSINGQKFAQLSSVVFTNNAARTFSVISVDYAVLSLSSGLWLQSDAVNPKELTQFLIVRLSGTFP